MPGHNTRNMIDACIRNKIYILKAYEIRHEISILANGRANNYLLSISKWNDELSLAHMVMIFHSEYAWRPTVNTLMPRQNDRRFEDDTFKRIFLNENVRISIKISLKFVPKGPINNNPSLVQTMAWRRSGDKPLSVPMMVSLPTHICVTRPQWVKCLLGVINPMMMLIATTDNRIVCEIYVTWLPEWKLINYQIIHMKILS